VVVPLIRSLVAFLGEGRRVRWKAELVMPALAREELSLPGICQVERHAHLRQAGVLPRCWKRFSCYVLCARALLEKVSRKHSDTQASGLNLWTGWGAALGTPHCPSQRAYATTPSIFDSLLQAWLREGRLEKEDAIATAM
jgi:hypothetical protein